MRAIVEHGIGCDRALLIEDGHLVEAHLELPGVKVGDRWATRLTAFDRAEARADLPGEATVQVPAGMTEGQLAEIEIIREGLMWDGGHSGRSKPPRARALGPAKPGVAPGLLRAGPDLAARLAARGIGIEHARAHGPDMLETAGWSEAIEMARTGRVPFEGGELIIEPTAAFGVIDVDGHLPAAELALAAADAVGHAVRLFDLGGAIVIDFPTVESRAVRMQVGERLEAALPQPFERTAMNGFGLVQIVRPKPRPSLIDQVKGNPEMIAALELLRQAERTRGAGVTHITAHPEIAAVIHPSHLAELQRRTGRRAVLAPQAGVAIWGGHIHVEAL